MDAASRQEDSEAGVGVLGWFGFILVNLAAVGIIGISSSLSSWGVPLSFCLAYTAVLVVAALLLERRGGGGAKPAPFINLLWVLACSFVLVTGAYLAVSVFPGGGSSAGEDDDHGIHHDFLNPADNLSVYLPPGSSTELKDWADGVRFPPEPNLNNFQDFVFFPALAGGSVLDDPDHKVLWYSDGKSNKQVAPIVYQPYDLVIARDRLFFSGHLDLWGRCRKPFGIGRAGEDATLLSDLDEGNRTFCVKSLRADSEGQSLYIKATAEFGGRYDPFRPPSLFHSDGTKKGTKRLDLDRNLEEEETSTSEMQSDGEYSSLPQLGGILVFGVLPMLGLSLFVLVAKKLPGVAVNIFGGVWVFAVLLFSIVTGSTDEPPMQFIKWFSFIYSSLCYVAIVSIHIKEAEILPRLQDLEGWLLVPVSITFFFAVHGVLKLSADSDDGWWFLDVGSVVPRGAVGWWLLYLLIIIFRRIADPAPHTPTGPGRHRPTRGRLVDLRRGCGLALR